jgi:hypothetical protein
MVWFENRRAEQVLPEGRWYQWEEEKMWGKCVRG